jgi:hypothetical protein
MTSGQAICGLDASTSRSFPIRSGVAYKRAHIALADNTGYGILRGFVRGSLKLVFDVKIGSTE